MTININYESGSIATLMSTELNSLANNGTATTIGNTGAYSSSGGYVMAEVELVVTFGTNPTANTGISIWFIRAIDATNYEDGSASVTPPRNPDAVFPLRAVTTAQRITRRCVIPPGTFNTILLNNGTGQSFAASANTLKILPLTYQQGSN